VDASTPKTDQAADDAKKKEPAVTAESKSKWQSLWRNHLRPILILVLVFTSFRSVVADWNDVPTGSMRPNIIEGDRIFVNKLAYSLKVPYTAWHLKWWGAPKRGDVVVFYEPQSGDRIVKRVVGIPGDRIEVRDDRLIINGSEVEYDKAPVDVRRLLPENDDAKNRPQHKEYEFFIEQLEGRPHPVMIDPDRYREPGRRRNVPEFTVKEGWYYVMGDNRDNSRDSRYFKTDENGCIPIDRIVGRASRTIFSLDYNDHYLPRGDRWFKKLP
jgi:signal peptidase I